MPANESLRARLRALLDARHWTQVELARRLGRDQAWVSRRLNGKQKFVIHDLDALAHVFGLTVPELFFDTYGQWDRRTGSDRRKPEDRRKRKQAVYDPVGHPPTPDRMGIESDDD